MKSKNNNKNFMYTGNFFFEKKLKILPNPFKIKSDANTKEIFKVIVLKNKNSVKNDKNEK